MTLSTQVKLFLGHFAAILLVSGSVGTYFYSSAQDSLMNCLKSRLRNSAALLSQSLDADTLEAIRGPEDMDTELYRGQLRKLRDYVQTNADIAFLYVMRREDDRVVFVLDSDVAEPAQPGEEYPHLIPALMEGFLRPSVDREITSDQWGHFLSGYSPVRGGTGRYLIGIDMRADEVQAKFNQIRLAGLLSLAFSLLLAMLFSSLLARNFTRRINALSQRCSDLGGDLRFEPMPPAPPRGDELEQFARTFDVMARRLEVNRHQIAAHQHSLEQAHIDMERRVEERTAELAEANRQLRTEIEVRLRVEQMLEASSRTDYLTRLLNRRAMMKRLDQAVALHQRHGHDFCVIMMDVDHFKVINDTHGHDAGDRALIRVAECLRNDMRETDELARWGGEEFLMLLPETRLEEAWGMAQRMREQIEALDLGLPQGSTHVSGSFGVARFDGRVSLTACIKQADTALYRAKRMGRNRVELADNDATDPPG